MEKPETWEEGNRFPFFRAPVLPAHVVGKEICQLLLFVLKQRARGRGVAFFFGLKIYVKCIPEVVLGGDRVVGNHR